jgi:peptide/nickel transport system substrate-binding protein
MNGRRLAVYLTLTLALGLSACAPPSPEVSSAAPSQPTQVKKRIVTSLFGDPAGIHQELVSPNGGPSGAVPGLEELLHLIDAPLTHLDSDQVRQPKLVEAIPTVENGLWRVLPDGRMETTFRLKPGITWHDGTPLTADDLRFSLDVYRDRQIGVIQLPVLLNLDGIDVVDAQTAVARWNKPLIFADTLFSTSITMWLLPRHLLEQSFQENKDNFLSQPYWREGYVGVGPFKMQDWALGSRAIIVANDSYALGRPRLDEIEVRFFRDHSALIGNILAGEVHHFIGHGLYVEDVFQIQSGAQDVKIQMGGPLGGPAPIYPQFINPDPPVVGNLQFRRAVLMAIDRQEMTDTINYGLGPVAHSWVQPDTPEGRAVEPSIVRYAYDPRASMQMIEGLGYTRGGDGVFQGADGNKLSVQILTVQLNAFNVPSTLSVARYWQQIGLDVQTDVLPAVRVTDRQARALFPSFALIARGAQTPDANYTSRSVPTADNNYSGGNIARYGSPELDAIINRYFVTIPFQERMVVLGDMVRHQTTELTMLPLFFAGQAFILGPARLKNVVGAEVWNAHLWSLDE